MKYVRLKDIAEKTGVSVNTVSRALKGKSDIGKDTSKRIRRVAEELGYVPHAAAASLRSKNIKTIGVIVTYLDNPFYARILKGIHDTLAEYNYTTMILENSEDIEKEQQILALMASYRVAGILMVPASNLENNLNYRTLKTHHLAIVRKASEEEKGYFVLNSFKSGQIAADQFLQTGRQRPAYLGLDLPISCNSDRLSGYKERFEQAGMLLKGNHIHRCFPSTQAAYVRIREWVKTKPNVDSIFVSTDSLAFGVLRAFHDAGIRVPDDVAVIGHDDVETAQYFTPSLSTIRVPKYRLGCDSAKCLVKMIQHDQNNMNTRIVYEPELIVRESSA